MTKEPRMESGPRMPITLFHRSCPAMPMRPQDYTYVRISGVAPYRLSQSDDALIKDAPASASSGPPAQLYRHATRLLA